MQLRQAEPFGIFNDHQGCVGDINTYLDHSGRHQQLNAALLETVHDFLLFSRLHTAMNQAHGHPGQPGLQLPGNLFRRLRLHRVRFLDQRTNPVGLAAIRAGGGHPVDHLAAALVGYRRGFDRFSARGQFIDYRRLQAGIGGHGQCPGNWSRRHDQLVGVKRINTRLVEKRQPLVNSEPVLFIDDNQPQFAKIHALLHQGVGANDQRSILFNGVQCSPAGFARDFSAEPHRFNAQGLKPIAKTAKMLFRQQFSGGHDGGLVAIADGPQRCHRRNHGFSGADIALHQPLHRVALCQVRLDFAYNPLLGACELEGQAFDEPVFQPGCNRQGGRLVLTLCPVQLLHAEVMCEQFLHREPLLRGVPALDQCRDIRPGRRAVDVGQGRGQGGDLQIAAEIIREQFFELQLMVL